MQHPKLEVTARTVTGKQVKKLRREGILPANIYGKALTSTSVQVKYTDFLAVYKQVGETGLVDAMLDGERKPVLIKNIQRNHRTDMLLHADLYQVNLTEKVKSMVPLHIVGEPRAVADKLGVLLTPMSEIEVEALPEKLPENIEVNVENLAALDEQLIVADLKAPADVTIITEPDQVVARITEMMKEEVVVPTEEVAMPEVIGEAEKAAAADEEPAAEDKKPEKKSEEK